MTTNNVAGAVETVASHLHPTPSWDIVDHPIPTGREEIWRFTPMQRLRSLQADANLTPASFPGTCRWAGDAVASISAVADEQARSWRGISGLVPTDRMTARVMAEVPSSLVVEIAAEAELSEPVVIEIDGAAPETSQGRHLAIRVGHHARATVVLRYTGSATLAQVVELDAKEGSDVTLITIQDWADDAVNLNQHGVQIGHDAHVRHIVATLGGDVVRTATQIRYDGSGGSLEAYGVYFADAGQHLENRLFVDHNEPKTSSAVDYRGALQGKDAHSVWVGDVLIRKVAEGIETYEANRNLLLTDGCRADSIPNLEIETGQIAGAGHSSTVGRFDDDQLFYLMSRGIGEAEAKQLIVHGFFVDIIRRIGVASVEQRLLEVLDEELKAVGA